MPDAPEDGFGLPPGAFARIDDTDDDLFYEPPRLVLHIDEGAVAALTELYRSVLPAGGVLLDLMSSWVSHLPPEIDYAEIIGHGMNAEELAANPRLSRWFVQNLNRDPHLPLTDASLDAATANIKSEQQLAEMLQQLETQMRAAAKKFEFEKAAQLRDRIRSLKQKDLAGLFSVEATPAPATAERNSESSQA